MDKYLGQTRPLFSRLHEDKDIPFIVPVKCPCIIGIVGNKFSGKSEITKHLISEHYFFSYSLAEYVQNEAYRRRKFIDRKDAVSQNLKNLGDQLRKEELTKYHISDEYKGSCLARRLIKDLRSDIVEKGIEIEKMVVEGFKNPSEIRLIQNFAGGKFFLIGVVASDSSRFRFRASEKDRTFSDLNSKEDEKELKAFIEKFDTPDLMDISKFPWGRNVDECMKEVAPEYLIENDGTKEMLYKQVDEVVNKVLNLIG